MIEFQVLQREYPELVRAATHSGIAQNDIEKLTFSGPVLLKIIEHLVASNRHLGNQLVALSDRAEKLTEAMRSLKNEKTALQNNWNNDRWKWDSF